MRNLEPLGSRWLVDGPLGEDHQRVLVVLVRHAESVWNAEGVVQGQTGPGLTALGWAQARATAAAVAARFPDAGVIVRSDLLRVAETAQPAEQATGLPVLVDERLREIDNGSWSGKPHVQVAAEYPGDIAAIRRGEDIVRGGGETFAEVRERVGKAMHDIATVGLEHAVSGRATVLVFTHGGPVRAAVAEALGLAPDGYRLLESPANCSVTLLHQTVDASGALLATSLSAYNQTGHLPDPRSGRVGYDSGGYERPGSYEGPRSFEGPGGYDGPAGHDGHGRPDGSGGRDLPYLG